MFTPAAHLPFLCRCIPVIIPTTRAPGASRGPSAAWPRSPRRTDSRRPRPARPRQRRVLQGACREHPQHMRAVGAASFARPFPVLGFPCTEPRAVSTHKLRTQRSAQPYTSRPRSCRTGEWNLNLAKPRTLSRVRGVRSCGDRRQLSKRNERC